MRTISIISQKGGAGKTTLALNLAVVARSAGCSVAIFDTDPQASAYQWSTWRDGDEPPVIDCGSPTLLPVKLKQAAKDGVDLAIIDTPPHADIMAREAAKAADLMLIPCKPQAFDIASAQTSAELARSSRKDAFVVLMGGPQRAAVVYSDVADVIEGTDEMEGMGVALAPVMLTQRAAYHHSIAQGQTVTEFEPDGKAAEEVNNLWNWLTTVIDIPLGHTKGENA
ncbi:ParA family partition ATPase [Qipengyuania citrea]|uniref:ParA family partition ATPase n=1 Tax=Qipengyuania citrea TaxID=225971 RepID=UPI00329774F9